MLWTIYLQQWREVEQQNDAGFVRHMRELKEAEERIVFRGFSGSLVQRTLGGLRSRVAYKEAKYTKAIQALFRKNPDKFIQNHAVPALQKQYPAVPQDQLQSWANREYKNPYANPAVLFKDTQRAGQQAGTATKTDGIDLAGQSARFGKFQPNAPTTASDGTFYQRILDQLALNNRNTLRTTTDGVQIPINDLPNNPAVFAWKGVGGSMDAKRSSSTTALTAKTIDVTSPDVFVAANPLVAAYYGGKRGLLAQIRAANLNPHATVKIPNTLLRKEMPA